MLNDQGEPKLRKLAETIFAEVKERKLPDEPLIEEAKQEISVDHGFNQSTISMINDTDARLKEEESEEEELLQEVESHHTEEEDPGKAH